MDARADRQRGIYIILNTRWGSATQFLTVSVITEEELDQQMEIEKKKSKLFLHQEMPIFPEELQSFYSPVPNKCTRCTASIKNAGS